MKVGLALGGGGVRGLAHIPVLETLDELGIKPVAIAGTSMGSIIGALYASGKSGSEIRESVESHIVRKGDRLADVYRKRSDLIKWMKAFRPTAGSAGMIQADGLMQYLLEALGADSFEQLQIPFQAVATDYYRREQYVFKTGDLLTGIRASMSIPGVFVPVEHHGRVLVDGGLTNQVPHDLLPDDCDVTVAIDVSSDCDPEETKSPSALDALLSVFDIVVDKVVESKLKEQPPTIYLRPSLPGIHMLDFDKIETVFELAEPAMKELKVKLEKLLDA